jgi:hypothetical protein
MDFQERGCKGVGENNPALDRDQWYFCGHRNEPATSIKCWELLEELRNY